MFQKVNRYKKLKKIGEGTYGVVYKAKDLFSDKIVALKKMLIAFDTEGTPSSAIREIAYLKELNHENIVKLLDVVHTERKLMLVFEYIDTDLKVIMDNNSKGLERVHYLPILSQLVNALTYIHSKRIIHRDLKPQNILVDKDLKVKIADFGLARASTVPIKQFSNQVVTLYYRPPDILLENREYNEKVDVWSLGCILAETITGKILFQGESEEQQLTLIFQGLGVPSEGDFLTTLPGWSVVF